MKRVCAWCGKLLGESKGGAKGDVSHGICDVCLNKALASGAHTGRFTFVEPWEMTLAQRVKGTGFTKNETMWAHRQEIKEALASGKPVPAEVLKDYPDLKPPEMTRGRH